MSVKRKVTVPLGSSAMTRSYAQSPPGVKSCRPAGTATSSPELSHGGTAEATRGRAWIGFASVCRLRVRFLHGVADRLVEAEGGPSADRREPVVAAQPGA